MARIMGALLAVSCAAGAGWCAMGVQQSVMTSAASRARRIVVATTNPHKVAEIRAIFASRGLRDVELLTLAEVRGYPFREPDEIGATCEENARVKALAYAAATGMACLADDSGIEIDALGGRPGVISSHYFSDGRTDGVAASMSREERDAANNERVMREMEGVAPERRGARFVCVMVLAAAGRDEDVPRVRCTARGTFEGRIGVRGEVPRGANGFGYDPLFLVAPEFSRTSAELPAAEKNARSHRAAALERVAAWLGENVATLG
jgi:XTP/dITP diphosphohydrolase